LLSGGWRAAPKLVNLASLLIGYYDMRNKGEGGPVYSTEHGRLCPACGKPVASCVCRRNTPLPKTDGIVRVQRETKGRKGKGVTLITGVPLVSDELGQLARQLKTKCGSGGTVKDGVIEIQGDHCVALMEELKKLGYVVKRSGG
jgi:translation initiation factor 1